MCTFPSLGPLSSNMDQFQHTHIQVRGLKLHIAQFGSGPKVVLLLHGFPEIWYTWRHQMIALGNSGYRVIAPDFRGYGLSDKPNDSETTSFYDLVLDLLGILDQLAISKVFLISKDFGTRVACVFAYLHKERILGVITLGLPYVPQRPSNSLGQLLPKGCYVSRWQEVGRAEADFGRFDAKTVVRKIYILFSKNEMPTAEENQEILDLVDSSTPLPPWLFEDDIAYYGFLYEKSGFQTALQVPYRSLNEDFNIRDSIMTHPAMMIMGKDDYSWKFPGVKECIESGKVKEVIPNLEVILLHEGSHFVHEQLPQVVNKLILDFLAKNA
ncbi:hypothetical protein RND81_06G114100 [Saponaria officinalis]|uniref:AB hydrolase-1 domain-containing protein n=1 Tax=Saponaria officinalis TaxID=3572 RepID=A0AAW1K5G2_SAPOF